LLASHCKTTIARKNKKFGALFFYVNEFGTFGETFRNLKRLQSVQNILKMAHS